MWLNNILYIGLWLGQERKYDIYGSSPSGAIYYWARTKVVPWSGHEGIWGE
jgi:hypothetical protein